jgi:hypothetical protein
MISDRLIEVGIAEDHPLAGRGLPDALLFPTSRTRRLPRQGMGVSHE